MSATAIVPTQQAHDYLAAVERELDDLPAEERTALVEDLALHLEALSAEDDDRPLAVRLGDPVAYAADLRSAAGLPARSHGTSAPSGGLQARWAAVLASPTAQRVLPAGRQVRRLVRELRPAWWVLRGYLLVFVACAAQVDGTSDFPVPAPFDNPVLGLLLVVAAVSASVAVGRRTLPRALGVLLAVGGVILALMSLAIWDAASDRYWDDASAYAVPYGTAYEPAVGEYPLQSRHGPVTDVFPYAADGTPLEGVLLYDQDGRPLRVGLQEWWPDNCLRVLEQPVAVDGVPVPHSFPQSYELRGEGLDLHTAQPVPGRCATDLPRPEVPLPVFPPAGTAPAGTAPAGSAPVAPAPGD